MSAKILIVTDEPAGGQKLQGLLEKEGHKTDLALTIEAGLEKVKAVLWDAVIIDMWSSGVSGFEVCRILRTQVPEFPGKVLVVVLRDDLLHSGKAKRVKADDYVVKTPDFLLLQDSLRRLLGIGRKDFSETKVLIIEDSPTTREILKEVLKEEGFQVQGVGTGQEGLSTAAAQNSDIIIIDTILPDIDGFETCRRLRQLGLAHAPKIIITTGKIDAVDAGRALEAGADDYMVKTEDFSYLLNAVKKFV